LEARVPLRSHPRTRRSLRLSNTFNRRGRRAEYEFAEGAYLPELKNFGSSAIGQFRSFSISL
jgi:hypothetical protein